MSLDTFRSGLPEDEDLREVLTDPDSKEFSDLRDRMVYVYITGAFPTHLRSYFTNLLRKAARYATRQASPITSIGHMRVDPEVVQSLDLDNHPMVEKVRQLVEQGYVLVLSLGGEPRDRRPFSRVWMIRERRARVGPGDPLTVYVNGAVREGWR